MENFVVIFNRVQKQSVCKNKAPIPDFGGVFRTVHILLNGINNAVLHKRSLPPGWFFSEMHYTRRCYRNRHFPEPTISCSP